jgi:hypothetical protein
MSTNDVVGLTGIVKDAVNELKAHTQRVRDKLVANLEEAREVVGHVDNMSNGLAGAVAELKGALGLTTNGAPADGTDTFRGDTAPQQKQGE